MNNTLHLSNGSNYLELAKLLQKNRVVASLELHTHCDNGVVVEHYKLIQANGILFVLCVSQNWMRPLFEDPELNHSFGGTGLYTHFRNYALRNSEVLKSESLEDALAFEPESKVIHTEFSDC